MASVLHNTNASVCFHILHDDTLTEENKLKLREIADSHELRTAGQASCVVNFVDVSVEFKKCDGIDIEKLSRRFTRGTLFRLTLPDSLCYLDKVLYLDCDIVVSLDIMELWRHDITNYSLGGVLIEHVMSDKSTLAPEQNIALENIPLTRNGLNMERYVNCGVLLMNLSKIRKVSVGKASLLQRGLEYMVRYGSKLPDEEFLNAEYIADIMFLDRKFNSDPGGNIYKDLPKINKILHFGGHTKPWGAFTGTNADMFYWKYLSHTPWRGELIELIYKAATNEDYYHRHSKDCIKRLKLQMISNIKNIGRRFRR